MEAEVDIDDLEAIMKRSTTDLLVQSLSAALPAEFTRPIRRAVPAALAALLLSALGGPLAPEAMAQTAKPEAASPPLLADSMEIRLALSAAPPELAAEAEVWVLRRPGYERVRRGTNGYACLVERDHPESLAPICYDPEGARALLPGVRKIASLRAEGLAYRQARDSVDALYSAGVLPAPSRPVLSFMLSREQRLYATPEGPPIGAWRPHVMIHYPGLSGEEMGLEGSSFAFVNHGGAPTAYLIIPVARWSDGTPVEGS